MTSRNSITLEERGSVLVARCSFLFTTDAFDDVARAVHGAIAGKGYSRVLLDFRKSVGLLGAYELSQAGELAARTVPGIRLAFVIEAERNTGVVTRTASSLGLDCAAFEGEDEAMDWLLREPAEETSGAG